MNLSAVSAAESPGCTAGKAKPSTLSTICWTGDPYKKEYIPWPENIKPPVGITPQTYPDINVKKKHPDL
jgi:hypothetical protein